MHPLTPVQIPEGKTPPCDIETEASLLGYILAGYLNPAEISDLLPSADRFYSRIHGLLYEGILSLHGKGSEIDVDLVINELRSKGKNDYNLREYADQLVRDSASIGLKRMRAKAAIVADKWLAREMGYAHAELGALAHLEYQPPQELLRDTLERFQRLDGLGCQSEATVAPDAILERIKGRVKNDLIREPTGIGSLDGLLVGLFPRETYVVAAATSVGKSAFAAQIAYRAAAQGKTVLYISLEMAAESMISRQVCAEMGLDHSCVRRGEVPPPRLQEFEAMVQDVAHRKVLYNVSQSMTMAEIEEAARGTERKHGLGMVVVDHIGLVKPVITRGKNREQEVAESSRALRLMAENHNCPVLALSQVNRAFEQRTGEERRPRMHDLRESSSVAHDADVVIILHRPRDHRGKFYDVPAEITVEKNRHDKTGTVVASYDERRVRFLDL